MCEYCGISIPWLSINIPGQNQVKATVLELVPCPTMYSWVTFSGHFTLLDHFPLSKELFAGLPGAYMQQLCPVPEVQPTLHQTVRLPGTGVCPTSDRDRGVLPDSCRLLGTPSFGSRKQVISFQGLLQINIWKHCLVQWVLPTLSSLVTFFSPFLVLSREVFAQLIEFNPILYFFTQL